MNNNATVAAAAMTFPKELELIISEINPARQEFVREAITKDYFKGLKPQNHNMASETMRRKAANCRASAPINSFRYYVAQDKSKEHTHAPKEYFWPADTELKVGALVKLPIPRNGHSEIAGW